MLSRISTAKANCNVVGKLGELVGAGGSEAAKCEPMERGENDIESI